MGRRTRPWHMVQGSKAEALLAVDHYNTTGERRSFEAFVVHMHLAWLYLLLAEFARDQVDTRYWDELGPVTAQMPARKAERSGLTIRRMKPKAHVQRLEPPNYDVHPCGCLNQRAAALRGLKLSVSLNLIWRI